MLRFLARLIREFEFLSVVSLELPFCRGSIFWIQLNSNSDEYDFECQGDSPRSGFIFSEYHDKFSSEFPRLSVGWEKIGMDVDVCCV